MLGAKFTLDYTNVLKNADVKHKNPMIFQEDQNFNFITKFPDVTKTCITENMLYEVARKYY
jgi:hypothetical protein